jgi:hypothetical protein
MPAIGVPSFTSSSSLRRLGGAALGILVAALTGCHAIKVQLGMNAGASTTSSTSSSSSSTGDAAAGQSSSGAKKAHLGGGDKGPAPLLETLGRGDHDTRESSSFDGSRSEVSAPRFEWHSHTSAAQDRPGRHHL